MRISAKMTKGPTDVRPDPMLRLTMISKDGKLRNLD